MESWRDSVAGLLYLLVTLAGATVLQTAVLNPGGSPERIQLLDDDALQELVECLDRGGCVLIERTMVAVPDAETLVALRLRSLICQLGLCSAP